MVKNTALLIMTLILSLSTSALAAEPGGGIIEGQIVNVTTGGSSVAEQDITLKTYQNGTEVGTITAKADNEGRFAFDGLLTELGYDYQVKLNFQGVEYYSEWLVFDPGETSKTVEVIVYNSTTNDDAIRVEMAHTIIYVEQDKLWVEEYLLFVNESDFIYIGPEEATATEKEGTLRFSLPEKATELQYMLGLMELHIIGSDEGFVDTVPVLPGNREVAYAYQVNYDSGKYTYSRNLYYPTTRYNLLFQGEGIEVIGDQLSAEEPMDIDGTWFSHLSGSDLSSGDMLVIQLTGLPGSNRPEVAIRAAVVLAVLLVGAGFVYRFRKRRLQSVSHEYSPNQMKQELLIDIARLDGEFESGGISEADYRRLRTEKKLQLIELIKVEKGE